MALIKPTAPDTTASDERHAIRDLDGLLAGLADPDPMARRWCARDLAHRPEASSALVARLAQETEGSVLSVILTSLTCIGDELAVAGLVDCLRSEDARLRNAAIEAMQQLPDEVAPLMGDLLRDPDPDVRIFAVNVLESLRHPRVEDWLIEVIREDPHVNVCATAVDLLGEVGAERAREPLLDLKARFADEPYIQFAADLALKRLPGTAPV